MSMKKCLFDFCYRWADLSSPIEGEPLKIKKEIIAKMKKENQDKEKSFDPILMLRYLHFKRSEVKLKKKESIYREAYTCHAGSGYQKYAEKYSLPLSEPEGHIKIEDENKLDDLIKNLQQVIFEECLSTQMGIHLKGMPLATAEEVLNAAISDYKQKLYRESLLQFEIICLLERFEHVSTMIKNGKCKNTRYDHTATGKTLNAELNFLKNNLQNRTLEDFNLDGTRKFVEFFKARDGLEKLTSKNLDNNLRDFYKERGDAIVAKIESPGRNNIKRTIRQYFNDSNRNGLTTLSVYLSASSNEVEKFIGDIKLPKISSYRKIIIFDEKLRQKKDTTAITTRIQNNAPDCFFCFLALAEGDLFSTEELNVISEKIEAKEKYPLTKIVNKEKSKFTFTGNELTVEIGEITVSITLENKNLGELLKNIHKLCPFFAFLGREKLRIDLDYCTELTELGITNIMASENYLFIKPENIVFCSANSDDIGSIKRTGCSTITTDHSQYLHQLNMELAKTEYERALRKDINSLINPETNPPSPTDTAETQNRALKKELGIKLLEKTNIFFEDPGKISKPKELIKFKNNCIKELNNTNKNLQCTKERGWDPFLLNLATLFSVIGTVAAIISFGFLATTGHYGLWEKIKTDKQLDNTYSIIKNSHKN
jgi:hypothetical protein